MQTPELTLTNAQRLVPRQRLAAGAAAAPPRSRRALRLGLPDPAEERRQVARRPERHRGRLHRPARVVRGLPAGRRLDRPRPDLGPATPAKATSRSPARPSRRRRRRSAASLDPCETTFEHHMSVRRVWEAPRVTLAVQRAAVGTDRRARQAGRCRPAPHGRAPDARRRADLRLGRRPRGRRVEHRGDGPDQARPQRRADGQAAQEVRPWRPGPLRPGQVVSGRAAAALVAQPVLARRRRADLARPEPDRGRARRPRRDAPRRRASSCTGWRCVSASIAATSSPPSRTRGTSSGAKASCRATSIRSSRTSPTRPSAIACAASSSAASSSRSAMRLPIARDERDDRRWRSSPWYLRDDRCYLIQGDSPLGFRLPLRPLPWARAGDMPWIYPPDANDDLPPLAARRRRRRRRRTGVAFVRRGRPAALGASTRRRAAPTTSRTKPATRQSPAELEPGQSAGFVVRTAISAEARHGRLYVFMPPTSALDDYLALVAAVEDDREGDAPAGRARRLRAAQGSAPGAAARHARSGRDRGQRQSGVGLERAGRADHAPLRDGARDAPDDREVHARRPPHRHRRRQPLRPRRRDAGRLAVPAPARSARQHDRLLAQPSGAELPVLGHVRRPDEPGAAHRRGEERLGLRDRDRLRRAARVSPRSRPARHRPG